MTVAGCPRPPRRRTPDQDTPQRARGATAQVQDRLGSWTRRALQLGEFLSYLAPSSFAKARRLPPIEVHGETCLGGVPVRRPGRALLGVRAKVQEGEGLQGGVTVPGPRVLGRVLDVLPVLEQRAVEVLAREGLDGRVHPVLGVQEVDRVPAVLQALEKGALEGRGAAGLGEDRGRQLLRVADQDAGGGARLGRRAESGQRLSGR